MYWLTGFLGIASIAAPFIFNYSNDPQALWTSVGIGAALTVVSFMEGLADDKQKWEYWVAGLLGLGAIAAPFLLGFTATTSALWTSMVVGLVALIVAATKLTSGTKLYE